MDIEENVIFGAPVNWMTEYDYVSASEYIMWMDVAAAGDGADDAAAGADYDAESALQLQALFPTPAAMLRCETAVWQRIRSCADEYAQRVSAPAKSSGGSGAAVTTGVGCKCGWKGAELACTAE